MRKRALIGMLAFGMLLGGCSFDFFGLYPQNEQKQSLASGSYKATIINYVRKNKTSYIYKFSEFGTGKLLTAHSSRYYYNSGDVALINVKDGNILSMSLISRKPNFSSPPKFNSRSVDTSKKNSIKKNNSIAVPSAEKIVF